MNSKPKAVVLLSGGLDSTTTLAIAQQDDGFDVHAISFDYGQRHENEINAAKIVFFIVISFKLLSFKGHLASIKLFISTNREQTAALGNYSPYDWGLSHHVEVR